MKTNILISIACCALISCGGSAAKDQGAGSSSEQSVTSYSMPDGGAADLRGKVKSMRIRDCSPDECDYEKNFIFTADREYAFSDKGEIVFEGNAYSITRDSLGRLSSVTYEEVLAEEQMADPEREPDYSENAYTYSPGGFLDKWQSSEHGNTGHICLTYNEDGDLVSGKAEYLPCTSEIWEIHEIAYKILERDSHGNWTKRDVERTYFEKDFEPKTVRTVKITQQRDITYY